jgi:hypothetical protein
MPAISDTGERFRGLPMFRLGSPDRDAARARRTAALMAIMRAESRGEPVTAEMETEAHAAKVELFKVMGWGTPRRDPE